MTTDRDTAVTISPNRKIVSECIFEKMLDRAVMSALASDPAYLNANGPDEQAERERDIEDWCLAILEDSYRCGR